MAGIPSATADKWKNKGDGRFLSFNSVIFAIMDWSGLSNSWKLAAIGFLDVDAISISLFSAINAWEIASA